MISGIGVDIVQIPRIEGLIEQFGNKFLERTYTEAEIRFGGEINDTKKRTGYFAKRFAAKEALSKALGTGISEGLQFKDIAILNDERGRPYIETYGKAIEITKNFDIHVSLSDDYPIAIAYVVITEC